MRKIALLTAAACALLWASGCAGWRSGVDPNAARYNDVLSSSERPSGKVLLLSISARHLANDQTGTGQDRTPAYEKAAMNVFRKSGLFSEVGTDVADPDLELVLNIDEMEHFSEAGAFISGMTLLILPMVDRVTINCEGTIHSAGGSRLGEVSVHEEVTAVFNLLLLPATPSTFIAFSRSRRDVFRSVLVQTLENPSVWR